MSHASNYATAEMNEKINETQKYTKYVEYILHPPRRSQVLNISIGDPFLFRIVSSSVLGPGAFLDVHEMARKKESVISAIL